MFLWNIHETYEFMFIFGNWVILGRLLLENWGSCVGPRRSAASVSQGPGMRMRGSRGEGLTRAGQWLSKYGNIYGRWLSSVSMGEIYGIFLQSLPGRPCMRTVPGRLGGDSTCARDHRALCVSVPRPTGP